jgi:hypothetical protein
MRAFVISLEAITTLLLVSMAAAAIADASANSRNAHGGAEEIVREMQAHDLAWIAGQGGADGGEADAKEWNMLADGLGGCIEIADAEEMEIESHGSRCGNKTADAFSSTAIRVRGGNFRRVEVRLEK